jgi:hypothetical protein
MFQADDRGAVLPHADQSASIHPLLIEYRIHVRTSNLDGAGTSSAVRLLLCGDHREEEFSLDKSLNHLKIFRRGCEDIFTFKLASLGILRSATVLHSCSGPRPSWHLHEIEVIDTDGMLSYLFECRQRVSAGFGQAKVVSTVGSKFLNWISLRLKKPQQRVFPTSTGVYLYTVHVRTSDLQGAGTKANVFLSLTGELGSVQSLELQSEDFFQAGSDKIFKFYLPPLGSITSITVSLDGFGRASTWHLQHIDVLDTHGGKSFLFSYCQWLSKNATVLQPHHSESNILICLTLKDPVVNTIATLYKSVCHAHHSRETIPVHIF